MLPPPDRRAALAPVFTSRIAERLGAGIAAHRGRGLGRPGGFRLPAAAAG
jgi:hypothetical protein